MIAIISPFNIHHTLGISSEQKKSLPDYIYVQVFSRLFLCLFLPPRWNWQLGSHSTTMICQYTAMMQWQVGQGVIWEQNALWCSWNAKNQENGIHSPGPAYLLWSSSPSVVCKHLCVIGLQSKADFLLAMSFPYCLLLSFTLLCCIKQSWESNSIFFPWCLHMSDTRAYLSIYLSIKTHISPFVRPFSLYPLFHLYLQYFYALFCPLAGIYCHSSSTLTTYPWWMPHD